MAQSVAETRAAQCFEDTMDQLTLAAETKDQSPCENAEPFETAIVSPGRGPSPSDPFSTPDLHASSSSVSPRQADEGSPKEDLSALCEAERAWMAFQELEAQKAWGEAVLVRQGSFTRQSPRRTPSRQSSVSACI